MQVFFRIQNISLSQILNKNGNLYYVGIFSYPKYISLSKKFPKLKCVFHIPLKIGKFVLNVQQNTQNVAVYLACQMEPIKFIVDRLAYGAAERLCNSNSDLVFESLAVAEGQGDNNHFYKKYFQIQELPGNSRDFKSQQAGIYIA